ncbi:MAG: hypothetical protein IJM15_06660 [Erysipelotrichaceae bacterium]|nr:hypothetical protein [Erysipelotrichaceae bacterium]
MKHYVFRRKILFGNIYVQSFEPFSVTLDLNRAVRVADSSLEMFDLEYLKELGIYPVDLSSMNFYHLEKGAEYGMFIPTVRGFRPKIIKELPDLVELVPSQYSEPADIKNVRETKEK